MVILSQQEVTVFWAGCEGLQRQVWQERLGVGTSLAVKPGRGESQDQQETKKFALWKTEDPSGSEVSLSHDTWQGLRSMRVGQHRCCCEWKCVPQITTFTS